VRERLLQYLEHIFHGLAQQRLQYEQQLPPQTLRHPVRGGHQEGLGPQEIHLLHFDVLGVQHQPVVGVIDLGVGPPEPLNHSLGTQRPQVRTAVAHGGLRQVGEQLLVGGRRPLRHVHLQDRLPFLLGGKGEEQFPVEPSGSSQGGVDGVDAIRCSDHDHFAAVVQAVHQGQQSRNDAGVDLVLSGRPDGGQTVQFVEEDDGRVQFGRLKILASQN
jgi:hypothetical protein